MRNTYTATGLDESNESEFGPILSAKGNPFWEISLKSEKKEGEFVIGE